MHMMTTITPDALTVDFRAPPPSPVGPGRRSSSTNNDDVLTEFLHQSLKVPNLVLPDKAFPRQQSILSPPVLDLGRLEEIGSDSAKEIAKLFGQEVGCLEVINHGISEDFVKFVLELGGGVFQVSPEKKISVVRSHDKRYGYEEIHGQGEFSSSVEDKDEEFVWSCGDEGLNNQMLGIWPSGYSNFSENLEKLWALVEVIGGKIMTFLQQDSSIELDSAAASEKGVVAGKMCHIRKNVVSKEYCLDKYSLRYYDVIRMLISGSEFPHALCVHICNGATQFQVYSKKGWLSFCPSQASLILTLGDKLQDWTCGRYKHVIGKPVFGSADGNQISMSFLYLPSNLTPNSNHDTVSITQQIILFLIFTLAYQLFLHIHKMLYN